MDEAAKYKDINMYITHHATEPFSDGQVVGSTVYEVTFKSVWPMRGEEKMPPPAPEAVGKCVADALAAFLPGTYEINYWVSERSVPPSDTVFGQKGEQVAKNMHLDYAAQEALEPSPNESEAVKKCRETAQEFGARIEAATTDAERKKIRKEFQKWADTDPTFSGISRGIKRLLGLE